MRVEFSYGRGALTHEFGDELLAVLRSGINSYTPEYGEDELVERAVKAPIGSPPLCELAKSEGCALLNMTELHRTLLTRKDYWHMTGNNINHPSDFLARLYAQGVLALLGE